MNEFLEKHGYFLEKRGRQIIIHHRPDNYGCIHILFICFLVPCVVMTFFIFAFAIALIPLVFFYFMEVDKRKKHANYTILDISQEQIIINKKKPEIYAFVDATAVVTTSEHIGGYASSDRTTTEEYRREINIMFAGGDIMTAFSFVSDFEEEEKEVGQLIKWLEKLLGIKVF